MIHFLIAQTHSQLVGGGLVLIFTGAILALMRQLPKKLWGWAIRRVTVEVEVINSDPLFEYVTTWLNAHPYSKRSRRLTATTARHINSDQPKLRTLLSPAPGNHVFLYHGNLVRLNRRRENVGSSTTLEAPGGMQMIPGKYESYLLSVLGRRQDVIRTLIEEIVEFATTSSTIRIFASDYGSWKSRILVYPRSLESVVLPVGVAEGVVEDVRRFLGSAEWYRSVGIPWHRGYLLHGLPGTGKSSLCVALAGDLKKDIYLLNLGSPSMHDDRLYSLMSEVRAGTIVLLEDVDCTVPDRGSKDTDRVSLSALLNCLDGIYSREGCMIFMTTNNLSKLDEALIRPGRVDVSLEFGPATDDQIIRLRERLAPQMDELEVLYKCRGRTMAEVQQFLLSDKPSKSTTERELSYACGVGK